MIKTLLAKIKGRAKKKKNGVAYGKNVTLEKNVSLGRNITFYKTAPITVGEYTMIANDVIIHTSTHDYKLHPMWLKRIDRPVRIGKHVWIGTGAIILPGVDIGDYSVVGAGAVVNRHVPEGAIVAGNPARIIKFRDDLINIKKIKDLPAYPDSATIQKLGFLEKDKICKKYENSSAE